MTTATLPVRIVTWSPRGGVLAYVGDPEVRVRVKPRNMRPALWRCDAHPSDGRTSCEHIAALAATPIPDEMRQP